MADIKLVINISEDSYKALCSGWMLPSDVENVINAIKNGTPLPEDFSLEDYERYKKDSESLSWIKCPEKMGN